MINNISEALLNAGKAARNNCGDPSKNKNVYSAFNGSSKTIEDFYNDFIAKRLPKPEIVLKWHKTLLEYCDSKNPVLFLRTGATSGSLRRGWVTFVKSEDNDDDFSFSIVYTDNDLATYFYKMALDEYCPSAQELLNATQSFKTLDQIGWFSNQKNKGNLNSFDNANHCERKFGCFPAHFLRSGGDNKPDDKFENMMNGYVLSGPTTPFGRYKYKHSHIFDSGDFYYYKGKELSINDICSELFPLGKVSDYKWNPAISNYSREIIIPKDKKTKARDLAKAMFLRFVNPMNHFLAPRAPFKGSIYCSFINNVGVEEHDIAEYFPLLKYLRFRFFEQYEEYDKSFSNHLYSNYVNLVFAKQNWLSHCGCDCINAMYKSSPINGSQSSAKGKTSAKSLKYTLELIPNNADDFKNALLTKKQANITITYNDGSVATTIWHAKNFKASSDLVNNVKSKIGHHKDKDRIARVLFEIK